MTLADLPRLLSDRRFIASLSCRDAAKLIGISPATLSRVERGRGVTDTAKLDKIAAWLGLSITLSPKTPTPERQP